MCVESHSTIGQLLIGRFLKPRLYLSIAFKIVCHIRLNNARLKYSPPRQCSGPGLYKDLSVVKTVSWDIIPTEMLFIYV